MQDWHRDRLGRPREPLDQARKRSQWLLGGVSLGMCIGMLVSMPIFALAGWPAGLGAMAIMMPCLFLGGLAGRRFGRFMERD